MTPLQSLRRRAATVAATVALLIGGGAGAAIAANSASPGDVLYGVDQALEAVGIRDGGAQERLEEVQQLVTRGDVALGGWCQTGVSRESAPTLRENALVRASRDRDSTWDFEKNTSHLGDRPDDGRD